MAHPETELRRQIGAKNTALLWESLQDVFRTGYGQVRLEIRNGEVKTIKTEVSRQAELQRGPD